ncbi:hypothetical protein GH714_031859 [Hevea brasiliensis]|uniref:Glucosamine/galactosamine-6-phosphate isomerase domain-containing protein n=1 Tax=Hevea brasiliensis TaxID=3981 RepID=A0A6A6LDC0_HEVBR|nr:hypothetical protein GH714_031859 [Hevea brasiliensis]
MAGITTATTAGKKKEVEVFDSEEAVAVSLAKYTADLSEKFCKERGCFTVVLSGGSLIESQVPILPGNVYAINDALSAEGAAEDYETCLKHLVNMKVIEASSVSGFPKFDLMLLGMGPDGHVASLFPGHQLCNENEKWVTCIKDSPKPPPERITFTFPVINSSAYVALVICGAAEAVAVQRALGKDQNSDVACSNGFT